jgi:hypothetical protein
MLSIFSCAYRIFVYLLRKKCISKSFVHPGVVAQTYNPSYLGSRGRRIVSSRPAQTKVVARPFLKNRKTKPRKTNRVLK